MRAVWRCLYSLRSGKASAAVKLACGRGTAVPQGAFDLKFKSAYWCRSVTWNAVSLPKAENKARRISVTAPDYTQPGHFEKLSVCIIIRKVLTFSRSLNLQTVLLSFDIGFFKTRAKLIIFYNITANNFNRNSDITSHHITSHHITSHVNLCFGLLGVDGRIILRWIFKKWGVGV